MGTGAGALRRKGSHVFLLDVTKQTDVDEAVQYVEKTLAETGEGSKTEYISTTTVRNTRQE